MPKLSSVRTDLQKCWVWLKLAEVQRRDVSVKKRALLMWFVNRGLRAEFLKLASDVYPVRF